MQASLARPSIGGAVREIFSASPSSPTTAFLLARGCTLTAKVIPEEVSWSAITSYMISTARHAMRACSSMVRAAHS